MKAASFVSIINALEATEGRALGYGTNWLEVAFGGDVFTVFAVEGFAMAWFGPWSDRFCQHLETPYRSFGTVGPAPQGDRGATCQWLVHTVLGQDCPVPEHLRKQTPKHEDVCQFLRSIDSLPTKNIGGLSFLGTAAVMAAAALEGRPADWVNETTREQRVAVMYGTLANCVAANTDIVAAIRALEKLEPRKKEHDYEKAACALAKHRNGEMRRAAALLLPIDHPIHIELAKDSYWRVRLAEAERLPVGHPCMDALAEDPDDVVREIVEDRRRKEK